MPTDRDRNRDRDDTVITRDPDLKTRKKLSTERPKLYKVILLNDDYTPFNLVVAIICKVFRTGEEVAVQIMMTAHTKGSCVIAVYAKDIAETKVAEAMDIAKGKGHALLLASEPEE